MFEAIGTLINSLNLFGFGVSIVTIALIFAITRGLSTTKEEMYLIFIGLSGAAFITVFSRMAVTTEVLYILTSLAVMIYLIKYAVKQDD